MTKDSEEQIPLAGEPGSTEDGRELYPGRVQGNRLFSCLLIAALFIIIDLAIILYVLRPGLSNQEGKRIEPDKPVVEQQVPSNNAADAGTIKE